jgi:hypothetical protein
MRPPPGAPAAAMPALVVTDAAWQALGAVIREAGIRLE